MTRSRRVRVAPLDEHASVTPLELFFDLVFVFSLTQVTALMANDPTSRGLLRGLLVLAVLWWCWVGFAWVGNVVRPDEGPVRLAMFAAMAVMFVIALTIPEAFGDFPGGLPGPVVFATCYFVFRLLHLGLFWWFSASDPALRRQVLKFAPSMAGGTALLLIASQTTGRTQTALWAAALVADYGGTLAAGARGWRLNSASHFAERHGLILIVALGESIVAIGVGVTDLPISWPIILASALGLVTAAALWWAYFDVVALVAERVLARTPVEQRARLARDSYSFLHLPMVVGIILLALGMKYVLSYVGGGAGHTLSDGLPDVPLIALYGGPALYLLAHVAFRLRGLRTVNWQRVVVALLLVALIPIASQLSALAALVLLTLCVTGLIGYEAIRFAAVRDHVRHAEGVVVSGKQPVPGVGDGAHSPDIRDQPREEA